MAAIVGAGDFIGAALARKFAAESYTVFIGRRQGEKLDSLKTEIEAAGGRVFECSLDAREEEKVAACMHDAEAEAPLEEAIFNIGANVNFSLLEITPRVFRKVWEMACYAGFLSGREAARQMLPRDEYHLTEKGRDLWKVTTALREWGDRWDASGYGVPTIEVVDRETDQELRLALVGPKTGQMRVSTSC